MWQVLAPQLWEGKESAHSSHGASQLSPRLKRGSVEMPHSGKMGLFGHVISLPVSAFSTRLESTKAQKNKKKLPPWKAWWRVSKQDQSMK